MFRSFLAGITVGGVTALLALQYHLVRTDDGLVVIPRVHQAPIRSAYVDTRSWTLEMWKNYPEVTEAVVLSGRSNLIVDKAARRMQEQPVPPIENPALRSTRDSLDSLININRHGGEPRAADNWLDPPPSRRMPDQKRGTILPPLAALDSPGREVTSPQPRVEEVFPETRLVPVPLDELTLRPLAPEGPAANIPAMENREAPPAPEAPQITPQQDGRTWLRKLFQPAANEDHSQMSADAAPPAPLIAEPVLEMATQMAEEGDVFALPRAAADAGPPSPRQLR